LSDDTDREEELQDLTARVDLLEECLVRLARAFRDFLAEWEGEG